MKKALLSAVLLILFCTPVYSSVTTSDGLMTLDYYEDTQSGIENRWVLDFSVNDVDGSGGVESIKFGLTFYNEEVDFLNEYNATNTEYYSIGYYADIPNGIFPRIGSNEQKLWIPVSSDFTFYTTAQFSGDSLIGDFFVNLGYTDNMGVKKGENFYLQGPIGPAVPEPAGMVLFLFGAMFLKFGRRLSFLP